MTLATALDRDGILLRSAGFDADREEPSFYSRLGATLQLGDFLEVSPDWPSPTAIIADGPYGLGAFPGDPLSHHELAEWYRPHVEVWSERAMPDTTLWF